MIDNNKIWLLLGGNCRPMTPQCLPVNHDHSSFPAHGQEHLILKETVAFCQMTIVLERQRATHYYTSLSTDNVFIAL